MKNVFKNFHVIIPVILCLVLLIITFSTNNIILLFCVLNSCVIVFLCSNNKSKLKNGLLAFIPFPLITITINILFVQQGQIILFNLGSRRITLEALIYAVILASKLLLVIYIFGVLAVMIDSDRAVSYFSSKMPKSTLIVMITLKLFPNMKKRIGNLREIYSIRGVDFESKGVLKKLKSYMPILSILLEDSLEKSFDIGEAAFVRGFLSSKRSIYDRQSFIKKDWSIFIISLTLLISFLGFNIFASKSYDFYALNLNELFFTKGIVVLIAIFILLYFQLILIWRNSE